MVLLLWRIFLQCLLRAFLLHAVALCRSNNQMLGSLSWSAGEWCPPTQGSHLFVFPVISSDKLSVVPDRDRSFPFKHCKMLFKIKSILFVSMRVADENFLIHLLVLSLEYGSFIIGLSVYLISKYFGRWCDTQFPIALTLCRALDGRTSAVLIF